EAARDGDRRSLARLLTLVEQGGPEGRAVAAFAYRSGSEANTVGITGAPGAGKSTLTARLLGEARTRGTGQLAVLAVDPTSPFSGGAILGDRIRMQDQLVDDAVYVRSMATRGHVGGLALAVPEALRVLAAVGFGRVIVETVGVGQVEVEVASATDTTVVVVNPKWGDAVQASKAGLLEIADIFVVNKADLPGARDARRDLEQMLDLAPASDWRPPVLETVGATGDGVSELWSEIGRHERHLAETGLLEKRRIARIEHELRRAVALIVQSSVDKLIGPEGVERIARKVAEGELDPYAAAQSLVEQIEDRGRSGDTLRP
ncbi:MAG TPA: methylmalonyl Co-A mutase-associated GTPase MeaB, partial [Acidimicrobiales bacterium]|nr:methylmalonyl Co-A mutase-associated GTPase MeaB [Acidimicrobiales bacterium]